ncbi:MAG: DNA topoisomerase IB [Gemmatimonadota bacterium]
MSGSRTPKEVARSAGLVHVSDEGPGIRRIRRGRGFSYHTPSGKLITDTGERDRINALAIPPAWTEVWISPECKGHIQATGRDAEGRKQYRYHSQWIEEAAQSKFHRMRSFGRTLPRIRRRVRRDLRREGIPRTKVLAVLVRLLDLTGLRVGSEASRRNAESYGLTTLRRKHVAFKKGGAQFRFQGKGGKVHEVGLADTRLAGVLHACYEVPGYELFQYLDEKGDRHPIAAADVNEYIRAAGREDFTARDFRTWVGTIQALEAMEQLPTSDDEDDRERNLRQVLEVVSQTLNNTTSVCREFYIHPLLVEAYLDGRLSALLDRVGAPKVRELRRAEEVFLALLEAPVRNRDA